MLQCWCDPYLWEASGGRERLFHAEIRENCHEKAQSWGANTALVITGFPHTKISPSLFDSTSLRVSHSLNTLLSDSAAVGLPMPTDGLFFSIAALLSAACLLLLLFRLAHLPACKLLPLVGRLSVAV